MHIFLFVFLCLQNLKTAALTDRRMSKVTQSPIVCAQCFAKIYMSILSFLTVLTIQRRQRSSKHSNYRPHTSGDERWCHDEHNSLWAALMDLVAQNRICTAYKTVLEVDNESMLVKLMGRTGIVLSKLDNTVASDLFHRLIILLRFANIQCA